MSAVICAAPGCDNPVERRPGRVGRPPILLLAGGCAVAAAAAARRGGRAEQEPDQPGRDWEVRLRHAASDGRARTGLGRFAARFSPPRSTPS